MKRWTVAAMQIMEGEIMLNDEQLQAIEDCGGAEMPIDETCIIAECTESEFLASEEARARYHCGQLSSKLKIRQAVVRMAREGVPQMVKIYQDFNKTALPEITTPPEEEFSGDLPDLPDLTDGDS